MNSFDLLKYIIATNSLQNSRISFCIHDAVLNWRQQNNTLNQKLTNIDVGIKYNKLNILNIYGDKILELNNPNYLLFNNMKLVSLCSKIQINESEDRYILMMNLHTANDLTIEQIAYFISKLTNKRFWIAKTDRYYHVYANEIGDYKRWMEWNINFLMLDCLVSPRYIGYSLRDGFNILRLNSTTEIKTKIPTIIFDSERG